jgi:hypothetical protein
MKSVQFKAVSPRNIVHPFSKSFNNARRKNQHMLQELSTYYREVEANTDPDNVKRITRKKGVMWSPATAKRKANELAAEMSYTAPIKQTRKAKKGRKVKKARKTHAHKYL